MGNFLERVRGARPADYHDAYDETSLWASRFGTLLLDELPLLRGARGLDVACGTGFPLLELAQIHGPDSEWIGIDIWDEALARAQRKIEILGVPNARVRHADAADLPFSDGSFDVVVANLGLNNFDDPQTAMREIARVCRAGAVVAMTTNPVGHMRELYALFGRVLRDLGLTTLLPALEDQERHRGTADTIAALFGEADIPVEKTTTRSFALRYVDGTAMLRHSLVQWFLDGWRGVTGPEHEAAVFAELERRLNEASQTAPLIMSVDALYVQGRRS
jgi:arsenite methyltransferase